MCIRTVEGNDIVVQSLDTVSGEYDDSGRYVSHKQTDIVLAGTTPTITEIDGPASGTYTTPPGCIYIDVYVVGAGGGGAGGNGAVASERYGGGGGPGDVAYGIYPAGSYSYALHAGGSAGAAGVNGTTAAQFSTFDTTKASGGNGGEIYSLSITGAGLWNQSRNFTLIEYGYNRALPAGTSPSQGGYQLFNGQGGRPTRSTGNNAGGKGILGGGGAGGCRAAAGGAGANSYLLIIEYY
jgi:hypothetical protein